MGKPRADGQLSGMAGEFLTVGKLFKRGYQASVTLGNAKAVDVLVYNPNTDKSFRVVEDGYEHQFYKRQAQCQQKK